MAMNAGKILAGTVAGGIVMNIIDFISNGFLLADRMKSDANAFKPGLGDAMAAMSGTQIAGYVIMDFIVAGLLAWTYAAMRPRFGPGAKTAIMAALVLWIFGMIVSVNYMSMGIMSKGLWVTFSVIYLVALVITALVAGAIYKEDR